MSASSSGPALANPAPLGLVGFGLTTVLLSLVNAGLLPAGGVNVVLPLAIAYGGTIQIIAGLLEYRTGNTFGMTAFLSYGAFWWWYALLVILGSNGVIALKDAESSIGAALLLWGVFTFYLWICTFRLSKALFMIFLTLWVTFLLLGLGAYAGQPRLSHWGGLLGIVCGALAMYTSFAGVSAYAFGREIVPTGAHAADLEAADLRNSRSTP